MSIKSDRWIIQQSNQRSIAVIDKNHDFVEFKYNALLATSKEEDALGHMRTLLRDPSICMIEPFLESQVKVVKNEDDEEIRALSKGVTSYGYDVTLSDKDLKIFSNAHASSNGKSLVINPKKIDESMFATPTIQYDPEFGAYVLLPPHSYLLGHTVEYFRIPRDVLVICLGKSTYARSAVLVNVTPIEPEFEGTVVIEIANVTSLPVMIFVNEGCAQFAFFQSDEKCETSYKDRGGKYMHQIGLVHAKV